MSDTQLLLSQAITGLQQGQSLALATVLSTWGSAPRPVGSMLVITADGAFQGSVSGGCVEHAVMTEALDAIADGACRILDFGVADADAFAVGLACGGNIKILVEPLGQGNGMPLDLLQRTVDALDRRLTIAVETDTRDWTRRMITPTQDPDYFNTATSRFDGTTFQLIHRPTPRLVIIGAVHIAQHLSAMAQRMGYDITVIDPRAQFATSDRFPDMTLCHDWPDEALERDRPDATTAVVTLTHDPKFDQPALQAALGSDAFYIGALGSKRTHAKRVTALQDAGVAPDQISRIHGPVGLDIGAKTPAEIAVSILAQITERLRIS